MRMSLQCHHLHGSFGERFETIRRRFETGVAEEKPKKMVGPWEVTDDEAKVSM